MELNINKILVPVDFSDLSLDALKFAASVGKVANSELIVLHVVESYNENSAMDDIVEHIKVLEDKVKARLDKVSVDHSELWGIKMTPKIAKGKIHRQIQAVAEEEKIGLIVMGTTGSEGLLSGPSRFFLGSNAYRTIQVSGIPVITLKDTNENNEINNIVFPVDVNRDTTQKVNACVKIAKAFDATVHILAVYTFMSGITLKDDDLEKKVDDVAQVFDMQGIKVKVKIVNENELSVAETVMTYSDGVKADLIAIMTRQESRLNDLIVGSTARSIITKANQPVLSIRPKK